MNRIAVQSHANSAQSADDQTTTGSGPSSTGGLRRIAEKVHGPRDFFDLPTAETKPPQLNNREEPTVTQAPVTFEQVGQHVAWQYNAGRDIIINLQSGDELVTALNEMQQQIGDGFEHQVISEKVATHMQQQLDAIIKQLQTDRPQAESILQDLRTTKAYLQEESVKLAQEIPQQRDEGGFFRLLAGVGTLIAIAFDLGITAAVVTSLFGLAAKKTVV